jgi:hypothetical protein
MSKKTAALTALATASVATGAVLAPASPAAAASTYGPVTVNCGVVTCSAYLSRSVTKDAYHKKDFGVGAFATAAIYVCAPLLAPPLTPIGTACSASATLHGGWIAQELSEAATEHGPNGACLKVTWTQQVGAVPPTITYWSTNNGKHCKD